MRTRTIKEIEAAFRDMGLGRASCRKDVHPAPEVQVEERPREQVFIRIEANTTPLEAKTDADVAQPPE